jgi:glucose-fructose oxidoreductase
MQRRLFLQNSGLFAASAFLGLQSCSGGNKNKLGIALVGLGYYSTDLLAPALQLTKNAELRGIVTGTPEKIPLWKEKYKLKDSNIYDYKNFDEIASNKDIDIVYIVLPPSMHRSFTERAAKAGKHVFCEKPMAPSVVDCQAMIDVCNDNNVRLAIGYRCQHDPNVAAYRNISLSHKFGKIKDVVSQAGYQENRTDHWKQKKNMGGGVMGDMGVYAIQGARMAVGSEPLVVSAKFSTTRPQIYTEVEETAEFVLEFRGGVKAQCRTSFGENINNLNINYQNGWVKMEPQSAYNGIKGSLSDGSAINIPVKNQQALQIDDDCKAIMDKKGLIASGIEGLNDIKVVEAIYQSVLQGGARVKI